VAELDVAIVSPPGTPGVLDKEVLDSIFLTETNSGDSVVNGVVRAGLGDNTGLVVGEDGVGGVQVDNDGTISKVINDGLGRLLGGELVSLARELNSLGLGSVACATGGGVRVVTLGGETSVNSTVSHGTEGVSTIASIGGVGDTINRLLLGEIEMDTGLDGVIVLNSGDSGEGPARTARSLASNGGGGSLFSPVTGGSVLTSAKRESFSIDLFSIVSIVSIGRSNGNRDIETIDVLGVLVLGGNLSLDLGKIVTGGELGCGKALPVLLGGVGKSVDSDGGGVEMCSGLEHGLLVLDESVMMFLEVVGVLVRDVLLDDEVLEVLLGVSSKFGGESEGGSVASEGNGSESSHVMLNRFILFII